MNKIERVFVFGSPVDVVDPDVAFERAIELAKDRARVSCVVAVNPEKVETARRDPELAQFLANAELAIPDGIGVVKAVRILFGKKNIERTPGADLMQDLCKRSGERDLKLFLFGSSEEVNRTSVERLRERFPDAQIVGRANGYLKESEYDALVDRINASDADVLFLALGSPRQENWLKRYGARLNVGLCMGVGGTLDTIAGRVKRAPIVWQKLGCEWLYRLARQPSRFWRQRKIFIFAVRVVCAKFISLLRSRNTSN